MKKTILSGLLLVSGVAVAAPVWHSSTIRYVYPQADGSLVLMLEADHTACPNTSTYKYYYLKVGENGVTADAFKNMMAIAVSAAATEALVWINFDDSTTNCFINRLYTPLH